MPAPVLENLTTLRSHLDAQKLDSAELSGRPSGLVAVVDAIALAGKWIAHKIQAARIEDVLGEVGDVNLHGENQQKLDVLSDQVLLECLRARTEVGIYASEERESPIVLCEDGRYCVAVDPLDGSSNVDVAVSVGTIFSITRNTGDGAGMLTALPHEFLREVARQDLRAELPEPGALRPGRATG